MSVRFILLLISVVFLSDFSVCRALSIDDTAIEILKNSPGYASETFSLESAINNLKTESNLPDPELSGEYLILPKDVDNRWAAQLEWGVEWPGVYGARKKEAEHKISAAEKALFAQRMERLAEIKDLLLEYIQFEQKLNLIERLSANTDSIYTLAKFAANNGEMTVLDLNKIRLESANIKVTRISLMDEKAGVVTKLSQLYGKDCSPLLMKMETTFPEIVLPPIDAIHTVKEMAPSVQRAKAEAEAVRKAGKVTNMEALPSLSLGYKHAYEDGMHFNGAVFGISIPMFSSRGKQKAAKADILEAESKVETAESEVASEAEITWKRLQLLQEHIAEVSPIVENTDYHSALLKSYSAGLISLIDYISDINYFTSASLELVNLRLAAAKAQNQLQTLLSEIQF